METFYNNCAFFLGSACVTKHPAPTSVPSFENGMPLKQRKVSASPNDVTHHEVTGNKL